MTREEAVNVLKQVISWRHDNLRGHPEMKYVAEAIEFIMSSFPSLPFNLDEAAEEYAYNNWEDNDYHTGASEGLPFDAIGHTEKCFKAGAEWMARQMKQEQPGVDLEKVAEGVVLKFHPIMRECYAMNLGMYEMIELVKSGFELGFNARKEESK